MQTVNKLTPDKELTGLDLEELTGDLPPELLELVEAARENRYAKIAEIGKEVGKKRDEAVKARRASGIEQIWDEDEEYYEGIDDANRDHVRWLKSAGTSGGISQAEPTSPGRCTAFFNITRQFVDSAAARMGDILLPAGDWNFSMKATPVPDSPVDSQQLPIDGQQVAAPDDETVERGQTQIRDWLVECQYNVEARKALEDACRIGTGILKGPVPDKRMDKKFIKGQLVISKKTVPVSKRIDPRDFFPDPTCGEDIHQGNYCLERDRMTARQLKKLKGLKGYLADQIDLVIDEGPNRKNYSDDQRTTDNTNDDDRFEVWYYYGLLDVDKLQAMRVGCGETSKDALPAVVTMVNETPIRAFLNPLDTGEYPYDLMPWQRRGDCPWGIGVARQGRTAQTMLNSAARAMMDNAGLSSGPMLIIRQGVIVPADGRYEVTARKLWYAKEQADVRSVADAIQAINIPMMQAELGAIIQQALKMMEDSTGISFLLQGQQGSAPDTVGGMELLHRNASAILRRMARIFDAMITEPHMRRYYVYMLADPKVPDNCKGDFQIEAIGSTALVEREIQAMQTMQLLTLSVNPVYGLDPEKTMEEALKSMRFIPEKFQLTEEQKKAAAQGGQMVPAIEVAKIRAEVDKAKIETDRWKAKVAAQTAIHRAEVDTDRDTEYTRSMAQRDSANAMTRMEELKLKRELALLDYSNKRGMTLDKIKSDLARESMRLRTQKELAGAETIAAEQVATPAVEPPGKAPTGEAFQK